MQDKREDMKQKQPINTSSQHRHDLQNVEASYPEEVNYSKLVRLFLSVKAASQEQINIFLMTSF